MKFAHIDGCSGVSGDMLLGALIDSGISLSQLQADLKGLRLPSHTISTRRVRRGAISARLVTVKPLLAPRHQPTYAEILRRVRQSKLRPRVITQSTSCLQALYDVETRLHGKGLPEAFMGRELTDTLVDIVGVIAGLERLQIQQLTVSPLNLGGGTIYHADHEANHGIRRRTGGARPPHSGPLPVPSPAAALLLKEFYVYSDGPRLELTTPTWAALIRTLTRPAPLPMMKLTQVGHGAGHQDPGNWTNVVRLLIGENGDVSGTPLPGQEETILQLETNLDDYNPQLYDHLMSRLFANGAVDVYLTPMIMKRGRPAVQVSVLASPERAGALTSILFEETPTLGIRVQELRRQVLPRTIRKLQTPDGPIRIKLISSAHGLEARPEFRDCQAIARRTGLPLRTVIRRAERLAEQSCKAGTHKHATRRPGPKSRR